MAMISEYFIELDSGVNFEPTPEIPGLQYFEGVDMNGMGMRAGLKPGDFLLEVCSIVKKYYVNHSLNQLSFL